MQNKWHYFITSLLLSSLLGCSSPTLVNTEETTAPAADSSAVAEPVGDELAGGTSLKQGSPSLESPAPSAPSAPETALAMPSEAFDLAPTFAHQPISGLAPAYFQNPGLNTFIEALTDPLSTFALDVDTGSYTLMRRYLQEQNQLPPPDSVRLEEYLNYFNYAYPQPKTDLFEINTEMAPSPFSPEDLHILRIGIQGKTIPSPERLPASLTLVIDVSGSMNQESRLGLVKESLKRLLHALTPEDRLGIVIYGSETQVLLEHTPLEKKGEILAAIESLRPSGSTYLSAGLNLGYQQAEKYFLPEGSNRVILCSDGVANLGATGPTEILAQVKGAATKKINLTTLGFGLGNYNDALMEQLANQGNGQFAYIDTINEAQRVLVENLTGTLQLLAQDAKIQIKFNAQSVSQYRLLGYENRQIPDAGFRNDQVDGGELGANHSVTALYALKLQPNLAPQTELASLGLRYFVPGGETKELTANVTAGQSKDFENTSPGYRWALVIAEFAEILRQSPFVQGQRLENLRSSVSSLSGDDPQKQEFAQLLELAIPLQL